MAPLTLRCVWNLPCDAFGISSIKRFIPVRKMAFSRSGFAALFFGAPVRARTDARPVLQQPSIERDQATALPPVFRLFRACCLAIASNRNERTERAADPDCCIRRRLVQFGASPHVDLELGLILFGNPPTGHVRVEIVFHSVASGDLLDSDWITGTSRLAGPPISET
jgi:hypothetical protein